MSLAARRQELIARSAAERAAIIAAAQPLVHAAGVADRLVSRVRRYPVAVAVVAGAVVFFGSRKLFDIATRAVTLYALFRR